MYRVPSCDAKETLPFTTTSEESCTSSKLCAQRIVLDEHYLPIAIGYTTMVHTVAHTIPAQFEHAVHKLAVTLLGR